MTLIYFNDILLKFNSQLQNHAASLTGLGAKWRRCIPDGVQRFVITRYIPNSISEWELLAKLKWTEFEKLFMRDIAHLFCEVFEKMFSIHLCFLQIMCSYVFYV